MRIRCRRISVARLIQAPKGDQTRPTLDKVKEAVFSRIGPCFDGGIMLDLFAGSGSMGLEALSRGIEHVYFVDRSPAAAAVIKANIASLQVEVQCDVWKCDSFAALRRLAGMGVQPGFGLSGSALSEAAAAQDHDAA